MRINTNISAMNAHRQLGVNQNNSSKSLGKLSSGLRINSAADDAAGLAISEKMRSQVRGLNQAARNAQDGISLIQTAEGALNESHSILQRMRELAVQAATDTNRPEDRAELQGEVDQLAEELTRIASNTEFNGMTLLNGTLVNTTFHIGANANQTMQLTVGDMTAETLSVATAGGTQAATAASATIQGMTITADTAGVAGNDISVVLADPSSAGASLGVSVANDVITVNLATSADTAAESASLEVNSALTFEATAAGDAGNAYTVTIVQGTGTSVATAGEVDGDGNLTITLGTDGSDNALTVTANDVAALTFTGAGATLFTSSSATIVEGQGDTTITAAASQNLTGGADLVAGGAITSTATEVVAAINALTGGDNIVTASGTGTTPLTAAAATSLTAGADETVTAAGGIDVSTQTAANTALGVLDTAIATVSTQRSELGAMQNRLEHTISNLGTSAENLSAAESRIRDVDMAAEMMNFTKTNILNQAATAMLAQANMAPQSVLQLLG